MATETTAFVLMPALVSGVVIGLYEILLVHRDVQVASHRFMHGLHGLVIAVIACLAVFNVPLVLKLIPALAKIPLVKNPLFFRIALGIIMMAKVHAASAAIKSSGISSQGMKETWFHSLLVGALVVASPYVYPLLAPVLPKWLR